MRTITIIIDGVCTPNPRGPAAWAWLALVNDDTPLTQDTGDVRINSGVTYTIADFHALLHALETARRLDWVGCTIVSDNRVLVNQLNGIWEVKSPRLVALNEQAIPPLLELDATLIHVPRVLESVRQLSRSTLASVRYWAARPGTGSSMVSAAAPCLPTPALTMWPEAARTRWPPHRRSAWPINLCDMRSKSELVALLPGADPITGTVRPQPAIPSHQPLGMIDGGPGDVYHIDPPDPTPSDAVPVVADLTERSHSALTQPDSAPYHSETPHQTAQEWGTRHESPHRRTR